MGRTCTPAGGSRWAFKPTEIVTRSNHKLELAASIHHDVMIETCTTASPCGLRRPGPFKNVAFQIIFRMYRSETKSNNNLWFKTADRTLHAV